MTFSIRQVVVSCDKRDPTSSARCFEMLTVWLDQQYTDVVTVVDQEVTLKGWLSVDSVGNQRKHYCPAHSGQLPEAPGFYADRLARVVQACDVKGDGQLYWRWIITQDQDIQMGEWIEDPRAVLSLPLDRFVLSSERRAISA